MGYSLSLKYRRVLTFQANALAKDTVYRLFAGRNNGYVPETKKFTLLIEM